MLVYNHSIFQNIQIKLAFLRRRVVADQVHSFGPDHAPYVHVVAHIDCAANFIACGPNQLWTIHIISWLKIILHAALINLFFGRVGDVTCV